MCVLQRSYGSVPGEHPCDFIKNKAGTSFDTALQDMKASFRPFCLISRATTANESAAAPETMNELMRWRQWDIRRHISSHHCRAHTVTHPHPSPWHHRSNSCHESDICLFISPIPLNYAVSVTVTMQILYPARPTLPSLSLLLLFKSIPSVLICLFPFWRQQNRARDDMPRDNNEKNNSPLSSYDVLITVTHHRNFLQLPICKCVFWQNLDCICLLYPIQMAFCISCNCALLGVLCAHK